MQNTSKSCLNCEMLGKCKDTTVKMVEDRKMCGSWSSALPEVLSARETAISIAGRVAVETLVNQTLPKKPVKKVREEVKMIDATITRTLEELTAMQRIDLRRLCRQLGMETLGCVSTNIEDMIRWAFENQPGGKALAKSAAKEGKAKRASKDLAREDLPREEDLESYEKAEPVGRSRKKFAAGRTKSRGQETQEESQEESCERSHGDLDHTGLLRAIANQLKEVREVLDRLGQVVDANVGNLVVDLDKVHAKVYGIARRQKHVYQWLLASDVLLPECAPEEADLDELEQLIEDEQGGNE